MGKITSIVLDDEDYNWLKKNVPNRSKFVRNAIRQARKEAGDKPSIVHEIDEAKRLIERLEKMAQEEANKGRPDLALRYNSLANANRKHLEELERQQ